ncbi:MAG: 16S rRNA (uracil(1498)-N(3))-methyltransferase [Desulfobacteraceae bacterium]|nr:16S rRNA (uracil(1498)-N(3))-methyltransferase [Desulfobacteraceae bacterium]
MRRFYIPPENLKQNPILLAKEDAHHVRAVLRLEPGHDIMLFDGSGAEYAARIIAMDQGQVSLTLLGKQISGTASPLAITLAQAYLKDKKMDELVRPLTELGVQRWLPFMAKRSVPHPDEQRSRARVQRWQKISQEAVKQCGLARAMEIESPISFQTALAHAQPFDLKLIFWEGEGGAALSRDLAAPPGPNSVFVMLGPEGGFEEEEHRAAKEHGFFSVHMGPRIMRAETATIAACTLVQFVFGDMGNSS